MPITIQHRLWPFQPSRWHKRMTDDADRLLAEHGPAAFDIAADRSWREDVGLLKTRDAGHWSRVTLELGRRLAVLDLAPREIDRFGVLLSLDT